MMMNRFIEAFSKIAEGGYSGCFSRLLDEGKELAVLVPETGYKANAERLASVVEKLSAIGAKINYLILVNPDMQAAACPQKTIMLENIGEYAGNISGVFVFDYTVSCCMWEYIHQYGIKTIFLNTVDTVWTYQFIMTHMKDIFEIYNLLGDKQSKEVFLKDVISVANNSCDECIFAAEPQYMLAGYMPEQGDIAIDGGCYDGLNARDFTLMGAKVYGFELNVNNYSESKARAEEYGFVLENCGLGAEENEIRYVAACSASRVAENGEMTGKLIDIDTYVERNKLPAVNYIKLDVEGAELDVLKGACRTIARFKPKMAISAYHKTEDLWELAKYVKEIRPDYTFAWRHYGVDVSEYYGHEAYKAMLHKFGLGYLWKAPYEKVLYCR